MHFPSNAELLRERLQFRLQRPLARDDEFGLGEFPRKDRKGTNGRSDAFLLDQPAGLQDSPVAVGRKFPRHRRELVERNSGAINSNLFRRATEFDQAISQRLRSSQNDRDGIEENAQFFYIIFNILLDRNIGAMKRNQARSVPFLNEGQ
jgi:hypothetical protein